MLRSAHARVVDWRSNGGAHAHYCAAWEELLTGPVDALLAFLESDTERSRELRQVSPFAGVLPARERWRILRALRVSR